MKINYNTLTAEKLEERVEFVNWSLVPSRLLTEDVIKSFGNIPKLKTRLWFEDLMSRMVIKKDKIRFPNCVCFFVDDKCYMLLNQTQDVLLISYDLIWSVFFTNFRTAGLLNNYEIICIKKFIKNIANPYFKNKDLVIDYKINLISDFMYIEKHFKEKESNARNR